MPKREPVTLPLPGVSLRPGRPATGKALTNAQRQKIYRERHKLISVQVVEQVIESFEGETNAQVLEWLATGGPKLREKAWIELGRRNGFKFPL